MNAEMEEEFRSVFEEATEEEKTQIIKKTFTFCRCSPTSITGRR